MPSAERRYGSAAKAMIAATALAALLLSAGLGGLPFFPFAYLVALMVVMPIGMILYAAAHVTRAAGWIASGIGGVLTSAVLWLPDLFDPPSFDEQWFDGVATITAGAYTQRGWIEHLVPSMGIAATGLVSGLFFWFLFTRRAYARRAQVLAYLLAGLAVAVAIAYPFVMQDRSCHSDYSRPAVAQMGLEIPPDQWPALAALLDDFGRKGGWSARYSLSRGPGYPWLDFGLCKPHGMRLYVQATPDFGGPHHPAGVSLMPLQDGADWKPVMRALHDRLKARWPAAIRYQDANGVAITGEPDWLRAPPAAPR